MENSSLNWQDSLNPQLLQRLVLLGQQPGIIKQDIGQKIIARCDRFLNRLPLLSQYLQRWQGLKEMSVNSVPIVYALPPLQELEKNERITVNQVNHLASNTEKMIETKIESSQSPLVTINDAQEKREPVTENPIVVQLSTVNEISSPIEMPLSMNANSVTSLQESGKNENFTVKAIATSSTPIAAKPRSKNQESSDTKNSISGTQYQTVYPLSIIDNFLSSSQTYSLINNILKKEDPLPIAKIIDRSSNDLDRQHLIVNPLSYKNSSQLLSQNKSIQERPLSQPLSSTNSSLVDYSENTQKIFSRFSEKAITENLLVQTTLLEQKKIKLPAVKITNQSPPEKLENQFPVSPSSPSKMPRINAKTRVDSPTIATSLPLASRSPSLPSSANFDVQRRSPQQSPEVPNVFAAPFPPTENRVSPMQTAPPKVDLEAIAHKVERKIMRRLVIESERRGQKR
jgi:hypothetical protein